MIISFQNLLLEQMSETNHMVPHLDSSQMQLNFQFRFSQLDDFVVGTL